MKSMTVFELIRELTEYAAMGMGDEPVEMYITDTTGCGRCHGANIARTEPGDGLETIFLLDDETT